MTIKEREFEFIEQVGKTNNIFPAIWLGEQELEPPKKILNQNELQDFIEYWTEKNPNGRKMRFEKEKTFDIKRRLQRWKRNDSKWNNKATKPTKADRIGKIFSKEFGGGKHQ